MPNIDFDFPEFKEDQILDPKKRETQFKTLLIAGGLILGAYWFFIRRNN